MNGKILKVKQNNLQFGAVDRYVNVLGCFKYKINGNVYIIYCDIDTKYSVVYYGSGHVRYELSLCMPIRNKEIEEEIIKEYIFKVTNNEPLDNFDVISLETVTDIEIIDSTKLELKHEILTNLIDKVIPKTEVKEEIKKEEPSKNKKKVSMKPVLLGVLVAIGFMFLYYILFVATPDEGGIAKSITCKKNYQHEELEAVVEEVNKYNFNVNDELKFINTTLNYQFIEEEYQDFIMRGIYYKYMPSSKSDSWSKDDNNYLFITNTKTVVDTSYSEPTNYETVLAHYKVLGYTCTEKIEE